MVQVFGEPEDRDFLYPDEALCTDAERAGADTTEVTFHPRALLRADYTWACPDCMLDTSAASCTAT